MQFDGQRVIQVKVRVGTGVVVGGIAEVVSGAVSVGERDSVSVADLESVLEIVGVAVKVSE